MLPILNKQEQVSYTLRGLYQNYGYQQYKVSNFEEYDLYASNREFLVGNQILTFSDTNGHLMALKPDITLSVIKNMRTDSRTRKVWYTENVYRVPHNSYGFQEIMQTGLECIGTVDRYVLTEVLMLACRSLQTISDNYVLSLSHLGILSGILAEINGSDDAKKEILEAISEKNPHSLLAVCHSQNISENLTAVLQQLCITSGPVETVLDNLMQMELPASSKAAAEELRELCIGLSGFGKFNVHLDLSVVNHFDYYTGIVFRGFVDNVAACVLSGGQYDGLLQRMGKEGGAIGFAVYLDNLERLSADYREYDIDTLLVYSESDSIKAVAAKAKELADAGEIVRIQSSAQTHLRVRRKITLSGKEAE